MQLLKAYDTKFANTRRWLDDKTELILLERPLVYHFGGHLNALHTWNLPVFFFLPIIFFFFLFKLLDGIFETLICCVVEWDVEIIIQVFLFITKVVLWEFQIYRQLSV